jgi:hypothetical protein
MRRSVSLAVVAGLVETAGAVGAFLLLADGAERAVRAGPADEAVPPPSEWTLSAAEAVALASVSPGCWFTEVRGDFDGDGARDVAIVYPRPRPGRSCGSYEASAGRDRVAVQLASGPRFERWLTPGLRPYDVKTSPICSPDCAAFAAPDLDADGRSELALEHGHGASESWFGVYRVSERGLRRLRLASGADLDFTYFGSVAHGGDVVCRARRDGARLVVQGRYGAGVFATPLAETVYRFDGRSFRLDSVRTRLPGAPWGTSPIFRGRRCVVPVPGS